ncbi:MAG: PfkB family carbohydrate kinase [Roseiflexaceae bacterium]
MPATRGASSPEVIVIGAACLDIKARMRSDTVAGTSNPGDVRISVGGVARNIAENLARLGTSTALLSVVCIDDFGRTIIEQTKRAGVVTDYIVRSCDHHSAAYIALLGSQGHLLFGIDDTLATSELTPDYIAEHTDLLVAARMVVIDSNVSLETAEQVLSICSPAGVPVVLVPVAYASSLRYRHLIGSFYLVTPNEIEAQALTDTRILNDAQAILAAKQITATGVEIAIVTRADAGLAYATPNMSGNVPALEVEVVDTTGAGDALTATVIYALLNDIPIDEAVRLGVSAAALTLNSSETVRQDLSLESLYAQLVL